MSRFFPNYKDNKITSPYGMRTLNGATSMHNGIDLVAKATNGASCIDYIAAHTGGTVSAVGYEANGAGNYVYIDIGNNVQMAYFHMKDGSIRVKKGEKVRMRQIIGTMGSTGRSTGAHLHWGIKVNGKWIDPTPYLDTEYPIVNANTNKGSATIVNVELEMLKKGSKGPQVKTLQRLLNALGFNVGTAGIDGDFGNATHNAVKKFQQYNGIGVDGIVGKDTWNTLLK